MIILIIKSIKLSLLKRLLLFLFIILLASAIVCFCAFNGFNLMANLTDVNQIDNVLNSDVTGEDFMNQISNISTEELAKDSESSKSYIKWVDFKGTASVLKKLSDLDISSHTNNEPVKLNWIELMAYFGCKYGGNLALFKQSDLDTLVANLRNGKTIEELTSNMKLYNYFYQSYDAIFHEYIGEYEIETTDANGNTSYTKKYGLKVFLPIAKNYSFSHYKDFGTARSYGYRRLHLGNDLLRKYWYSYYSRGIRLCRSSWLEPIRWMENWHT